MQLEPPDEGDGDSGERQYQRGPPRHILVFRGGDAQCADERGLNGEEECVRSTASGGDAVRHLDGHLVEVEQFRCGVGHLRTGGIPAGSSRFGRHQLQMPWPELPLTLVLHDEGYADMPLPSLLAVFAHPDDESLSSGGVLARHAASGARTAVT